MARARALSTNKGDFVMTQGIKLYGHQNCVQCRYAKRDMDAKGITYEYCDTQEDPKYVTHLQSLGFTQVPVTETETETWYGFQPDKISGLAQTSSPSIAGQEEETRILQLALSRGLTDDMSTREREDILEEATWVLEDYKNQQAI